MQHWVVVHKFECHGSKTGSPGSLDTESWRLSGVHSPGSPRSDNHKVFVDFTDGSNVNEVGPPARVLLNLDGPTPMQQKNWVSHFIIAVATPVEEALMALEERRSTLHMPL
jgi:hypothetical protein